MRTKGLSLDTDGRAQTDTYSDIFRQTDTHMHTCAHTHPNILPNTLLLWSTSFCSARRLAQEYFAIRDPDYYEFEAHIFFDDAMEDSHEGERTFNKYVSTLVETVDRAASAVHQTAIEIAPPIKTPTPYGGR